MKDYFGWFKTRKTLKQEDITVVDKQMLKKAILAASLGNAMEWYDFGVYSYVAVIIGKIFFPSNSPVAQLLATFATFAVAFIVRPFGGLVFGPLGDKYGRSKILALTMILMATGTICIGLIPPYAKIGIAAPILLLAARMVQGFSTGGEYGGAATFIAEYATDKQRGFMGSWLEFGTLCGYVIGALVVVILQATLTTQDMLSWGWRIAFFLGGPLGLFGLYMRSKLEETPAFQQYMDKQSTQKKTESIWPNLFRTHYKQILKCIGLVLLFNVSNYMIMTYIPSYMTVVLGYSENRGLILITLIMALMPFMNIVNGYISDHVGRRPVIYAGCFMLLVLALPSFYLIQSNSNLLILLGLLLLSFPHVCFSSTMPTTLPALFYTPIRYTALAFSFNVSVSLFGGTTPLVTAWLVKETGNIMMPAWYLMGAACIGILTVMTVRETANMPLRGSPPAVGSKKEAQEYMESDHPVTVDKVLPPAEHVSERDHSIHKER